MLITAMMFVVVSVVGSTAYLSVGGNEARMAKREANAIKSFYLAEAGVEKIKYDIKVNTGNIRNSPVGVPVNGAFTTQFISNENTLDTVSITTKVTNQGNSKYLIQASDLVGSSTKTVTATVIAGASADVFNYSYCINNYGWLTSGVTSHIRGDVFANGDFVVQNGPYIDGDIYAGGNITVDANGIHGPANDGSHRHAHSAIIPMPRFKDMTYYEDLATSTGAKVKINGVTIINAVYSSTHSGETNNLYLVGTSSKPIVIQGLVVVRGDLIISGYVTGHGTFCAGRNLYIADNVTYVNPPTTVRPASTSLTDIDAWVTANKDKDLVCFAAKQNLIFGYYNNPANAWLYSSYLFTWDREADIVYGNPQPGVKYGWSDLNPGVNVNQFSRIPGGTSSFSQFANNSITHIDGILYATHAITGYVGHLIENGSLVAKDECVCDSGWELNHDERVDSRYLGTPLWPTNLQLPIAENPTVIDWGAS